MAPPSLLIRPASRADIDALLRLEDVFPEEDRASRRNWRDLLAGHSSVFVAVSGDVLFGGAVVLYRTGATVARLYSIATAPETRGRGVGSALIDTVKADALAHGCDRLRLEVRAGNSVALSLYDRAGFAVIGRKSGFYPDGEDAIHMQISTAPGPALSP